MARNNLKPASIAGIEFDALIDEEKSYTASIPTYPVENGFPVSDTIILEPIAINMTLYVSNTPVTWLHRHGSSVDRVNMVCDMIEALWFSKQLVKIVTTDTIYTNMGITSLSIKHSKETGYAREISLSAQKIRVTQVRTVYIPSYLLKSGETAASAGTASTSSSGGSNSSAGNNPSTSSSKTSGNSEVKKNQSILYGAASGLGLI